MSKGLTDVLKEITVTPYATTSFRGRDFATQHPTAGYIRRSQHQKYEIVPQTTPSLGGTADFRIHPNQLKDMEFMALEVPIEETGGANAATPIIAPYLLQQGKAISLSANGHEAELWSCSADEIHLQNAYWTPDERANFIANNSLNMTAAAYAGESAISASGSATYIIPIPLGPLGQLDTTMLRGQVIIKANFASSIVASGSGTLALGSGVRLHVFTRSRTEKADDAVVSLKNRMPTLIPYTFAQIQPHSASLTDGTQTQLNLDGLGVECHGIWILIRASKAATSSGYRDFTSIGAAGTVDLVDNRGVSLLGGGPRTVQELVGSQCAVHRMSDFANLTDAIPIVFTDAPRVAFYKGDLSRGSIYLTGNEKLRITPNGTALSSTSVTVDVVFLCGAGLVEGTDGRISRAY